MFNRLFDTMTILVMTSLITALLIMTILITLNTGDITFNGIIYNINKCCENFIKFSSRFSRNSKIRPH